MDKKRRHFIGVDLGGTNIQVGVLDKSHRLLARERSKTKGSEGSAAVIKRIAQTATEALASARLELTDIGGLGIGAPGVIDVDKGVVIEAVNLRWNDFPLGKALGRALDVPVIVDNDVNVATWGEYLVGQRGKYPDLLGIWVGTGIGGGLVLGGQLYRGHYQTAGEIGHTIIHADAPLGRRTLENCASRTAIVNILTQLINSNHPSKVVDLVDGNLSGIRSKVLARALDEDDQLTAEVIRQAAHYVGVAAANSATLLSLPCVVIGGGFTAAVSKQWVEWVRESFDKHVFPSQLRSCKIERSRLGDDAGVIGAALLAEERVTGSRPTVEN